MPKTHSKGKHSDSDTILTSSSSEDSHHKHEKKHCKIDDLNNKLMENEIKDKMTKKKLENVVEILKDNNKKDKQTQNKLEHLINATKTLIKNNNKMDHEIKDLYEKLKHQKHKKKALDYETVVKHMRKEKCLMINGCDAYGNFFSMSEQTVEPNNAVIFEKHCKKLNLYFEEPSSEIEIMREGMYVINVTCQFVQPCQIALFVNDNPNLNTLTSSNNPNNIVTIHQILALKKCDKISLRNYLSVGPIVTSMPVEGLLIPESKNIVLNLWRIAPLPEHCCLPKQNKEPWCYFDSDSSSDSSSDSDSDHCKKHEHKSSSCDIDYSNSDMSTSCFNDPKKYNK